MLQKAMKDYNRIMGKIGDPIEEQQERGKELVYLFSSGLF